MEKTCPVASDQQIAYDSPVIEEEPVVEEPVVGRGDCVQSEDH